MSELEEVLRAAREATAAAQEAAKASAVTAQAVSGLSARFDGLDTWMETHSGNQTTEEGRVRDQLRAQELEIDRLKNAVGIIRWAGGVVGPLALAALCYCVVKVLGIPIP